MILKKQDDIVKIQKCESESFQKDIPILKKNRQLSFNKKLKRWNFNVPTNYLKGFFQCCFFYMAKYVIAN